VTTFGFLKSLATHGLLLALGLAGSAAIAADPYHTKPVRIVVPASAS
jgi:tripartite-type tricarboxylate transporter receptor subunit TctC